MIFTPLSLPGAFQVDIERLADERGFFARSYCADEFAAQGLKPELRHCSVSYNARQGTLRGLHYQAAPYEEHKLVRCTAGAIFDVIVDMRADSPTYRRWIAAAPKPPPLLKQRKNRSDGQETRQRAHRKRRAP